MGANNRSAVATMVERTSRYVILAKLEAPTAEAAAEAIVREMSRMAPSLLKTMTHDQGSEMARHAEITARTGMKIYFADPHSPWQRGSNENTNGLLRQYLPKGTDLSLVTQARLDEIAALANAGTLAAFTAVSVCLLVLRKRDPARPRVFRTPLAWVVAPIAIFGCLYLFWSLPRTTQFWFLVWNAIGVVAYLAYGRRASLLARGGDA